MPLVDASVLIRPFLRRAVRRAKRPGRVLALADRAGRFLRHRRAFGSLRKDLPTLVRLARAWAAGDYRGLPWRSVVSVVAALLYVVSPFDAIPDFLPVIGLADDAAVVAFVLRALGTDVADFRRWERRRAT